MSKIIMLARAPSARSLKWTKAELTAPLWERPLESKAEVSRLESSDCASRPPIWRTLPLEDRHFSTGPIQETQPSIIGGQSPSFTKGDCNSIEFLHAQSLSSQTSDSDKEDELTQFLADSYALYEAATSSQPRSITKDSSQSTSVVTSDSNATPSHSASVPQTALTPSRLDALKDQLVPLRDIPSAAVISSLRPQKIMRSLIVVVLAIPPIRPCKNSWGRYSRPADRLELTVADETHSGFGVTLWLPPESTQGNGEQPDLRSATSVWLSTFSNAARTLRLRDIILLQDVTLTEFRGKVYANSREGFTRLELLFRSSEHSGNEGRRKIASGRYSSKDIKRLKDKSRLDRVLGKTRRVWNWLVSFVGISLDLRDLRTTQKRKHGQQEHEGKLGQRKRRRAKLPPDTQ